MSKGPKPPPIEQRRRALIERERDLYEYIVALIAAREWKRAGDTVSGALDGYGAANRCWATSARWLAKRDELREAENGSQLASSAGTLDVC